MTFSAQIGRVVTALGSIEIPGNPEPRVFHPMPEGNIEDYELPCFGIGFDDIEIQASNVSVFEFPIIIYYFHERVPDSGRYVIPDVVLDMPVRMFQACAADAPLVTSGYGVRFPEPAGKVGTGAWYDRAYIGCQITAILKEKENTVWM
jgi:hypothetical protein